MDDLTMTEKALFLVDLRNHKQQPAYAAVLQQKWKLVQIENQFQLYRTLTLQSPALVCFEFDFPDFRRLSLLKALRDSHPHLPTIMLTCQHSEAMAVWALRLQLRDYLVVPIAPDRLLQSIESTIGRASGNNDHVNLCPTRIPFPIEVDGAQSNACLKEVVVKYVEKHYQEKIYERQVAQLCHMQIGNFSRRFKRIFKISFRDFLIDFRINKACNLLLNPATRIAEIAYATGFRDPSYFTRMFRKITGICPSYYRTLNTMR